MATKGTRVRMTGAERREQLITVARGLFAEHGFDGTSVEEVAAKAKVSKPVVYEHFGGKEGLYAVVVDREVTTLLDGLRTALVDGKGRRLVEQAATTLLDYIEGNPDGFRIIVRDRPVGGTYQSIIGDIVSRVEGILVDAFDEVDLDPKDAPMYSQMLVGLVANTGLWWLDTRKPSKELVVAHVVNLAWNGLARLEREPQLLGDADAEDAGAS